MVGYGDILWGSRRGGWEDAYLDYEHLKAPLTRIEVLTSTASVTADSGSGQTYVDICNSVNDEGALFLSLLRLEVEKVSLFALSRQGVLADAVGALIFNTNAHEQYSGAHRMERREKPVLQIIHHDLNSHFKGIGSDGKLNYIRHRSSVLPVLEHSGTSSSEILNEQCKPSPLFEGTHLQSLNEYQDLESFIDSYTYLGVELLHLVRFICVNAVGVRKIMKKYIKVLTEFSHWKLANRPKLTTVADGDVPCLSIDAYEAHLHQLASSQSIAAINSSLCTRLEEFQKDYESTHLTSLVRFKGVTYCLNELLKYSKVVNQPYDAFLSRKAMIVTGDVLGDLDMPTVQALEVMLKFNPDALMAMDEIALGTWERSAASFRYRTKSYSFDSILVAETAIFPEEPDQFWGGINRTSMILNLTSTLLYTVNYYIVAPTANHYAILLGTDGAFGATLVGASSFAAIFAAFLYSFWYTKLSFKYALVLSSLCPCIGNLLYALAITWKSMRVALYGRILCGFGSAEVINRQVISMCVSYNNMTRASALFVAASAMGMSVGPLFAAILDNLAGRDVEVDVEIPYIGGVVINHVTSPGFLMMFLWFTEMILVVFFFSEPNRINGDGYKGDESVIETVRIDTGKGKGHDGGYGSFSNRQLETCAMSTETESLIRDDGVSMIKANRSLWSQMRMIHKLIFQNPALPITLLLFSIIELADEVLISSCSMVCHKYFSWPGSKAGFLIASLGALVLPAHYVVERASRTYDERVILKWATLFICWSLFAILNYQGVFIDIRSVAEATDSTQDDEISGLNEINHRRVRYLLPQIPYDWNFGVFVYLVSLSAIFMGTIILEGVDTSLMSKAASPELNNTFINTGLLATLIGTFGRVIGDSMITISALIDHTFFTDFLNDTFFPMIPMVLVGYYLIRRYYSYLI